MQPKLLNPFQNITKRILSRIISIMNTVKQKMLDRFGLVINNITTT